MGINQVGAGRVNLGRWIWPGSGGFWGMRVGFARRETGIWGGLREERVAVTQWHGGVGDGGLWFGAGNTGVRGVQGQDC